MAEFHLAGGNALDHYGLELLGREPRVGLAENLDIEQRSPRRGKELRQLLAVLRVGEEGEEVDGDRRILALGKDTDTGLANHRILTRGACRHDRLGESKRDRRKLVGHVLERLVHRRHVVERRVRVG